MNHNFWLRKVIYLILIFLIKYDFLIGNNCSSCPIYFQDNQVKTLCVPISDSYPVRYFYHKLFSENDFESYCKWLFKGDISYRYQQTYNSCLLAASIFQSSPIEAIYSPEINPYLPGNYLAIGMQDGECNSNSSINAKIRNNFIDINFILTRESSNFYFMINLPIQNSFYKLCTNENVKTDSEVQIGGFAVEIDEESPVLEDQINSPSEEINAIGSLIKYLSGDIIGDMQERNFAKLKTENCNSKWGLADIYLQLGWDCFKRKNSNLGFYLRGAIPTSQKLNNCWAEYVFSPIIGNAGRGEIDFGANGKISIFNNENDTLELFLDTYVGYVFSANHIRTFDFNNGPMTRYAGVKEFDSSFQYLEKLPWAADITTQCIPVNVPIKGEFILDLVYKLCQNHFFNFGYNFKGQSNEQTTCACSINNGLYGLSVRSYVQTPTNNETDTAIIWTNNAVTPRSNMSHLSENDKTYLSKPLNNSLLTTGVIMQDDLKLTSADVNLNSGLMNGQVLNIIFAGYRYKIESICYNPELFIKGSFAISTKAHYSPEFWDILLGFSLSY